MNDSLVEERFYITDGAWGTELFKKGAKSGQCLEAWNQDHPEKVREVAQSYVDAGSEIILTNTFGASPLMLQKHHVAAKAFDINRLGAKLSKDAASIRGALVFGSVGPGGEFLEPLGSLSQQAAIDNFKQQIEGLVEGGVDGLVLETMTDLDEAACAFRAARALTTLPIGVSFAFQNQGGNLATMMGASPEDVAKKVEALGADFVGTNCGLTIDELIPVVERYQATTDLPIWFKPNMGEPTLQDTNVVYSGAENCLAEKLEQVVQLGVRFFGGCCGSTPKHIRRLSKAHGRDAD